MSLEARVRAFRNALEGEAKRHFIWAFYYRQLGFKEKAHSHAVQSDAYGSMSHELEELLARHRDIEQGKEGE